MPKKLVLPRGILSGQETKGVFAAYLSEQLGVQELIRYGGCNGSHYVLSDGRSHSFSHFGSGTFTGATTTLVGMVMDPFMLEDEVVALEKLGLAENMYKRIRIHEGCLSITPFHGAISRLREYLRALEGAKKGTIGLGVGEAITDNKLYPELAIRARDFRNPTILREKLEGTRKLKLALAEKLLAEAGLIERSEGIERQLEILHSESLVEATIAMMTVTYKRATIIGDDVLNRILSTAGNIVVEGSHGTLLHPYYGFVPHVSQVDPTGEALLRNLRRFFRPQDIIILGVLRAYMHRHGAGPLVSQDDAFGNLVDPDRDDDVNSWLGPFRIGPLDLIALRYSIACVGGPSVYRGLAISHLDDLEGEAGRNGWPICTGYTYHGDEKHLERFFVVKKGNITAIRVPPDTRDESHLAHQKRLTQLLQDCKPIISIVKPSGHKGLEQMFLERVERELSVPIVLTGHGPEVKNHEVVPQWAHLFQT